MKKTWIIIASLMVAVSCGKKDDNDRTPAIPVNKSVLSSWTATDPASVIQTLNLSTLELGIIGSSNDVYSCDGTYGNNVVVNGVSSGEVLLDGTELVGELQFGNTAYVGSTNYAGCRALSKERYTYEIEGSTLTLCNINCATGVYPSCQANPCTTFVTN